MVSDPERGRRPSRGRAEPESKDINGENHLVSGEVAEQKKASRVTRSRGPRPPGADDADSAARSIRYAQDRIPSQRRGTRRGRLGWRSGRTRDAMRHGVFRQSRNVPNGATDQAGRLRAIAVAPTTAMKATSATR